MKKDYDLSCLYCKAVEPILAFATAVTRGVLHRTRGLPCSYLRTYLLSLQFLSAIHTYNIFIYSIKCQKKLLSIHELNTITDGVDTEFFLS